MKPVKDFNNLVNIIFVRSTISLLLKQNNNDITTYTTVKQILKCFGEYINKLIFCSKDANSVLSFELIGTTHSSQPHPEIEFNGINMNKFDVFIWQNLLSNIRRLSFMDCLGNVLNFGKCIDSCHSLRELEVLERDRLTRIDVLLNRKIGQLETIILRELNHMGYDCGIFL